MKVTSSARPIRAFTWIELLIVITLIGIVLSLLLPNVRFSHEAARRMACSNRLKVVGVALHNYHDTHRQLPSAMAGTDRGRTWHDGNANRLSGLVAILPFIEQQSVWEEISQPSTFDSINYPAMGPAPWILPYRPWRYQIQNFQCPSSPIASAAYGMTSYAFCVGDVAHQIHRPKQSRGVFACRRSTSFDEISDGLSQTIAISEIGATNGRDVAGQFATWQPLSILGTPTLCRDAVDPNRPKFYRGMTVLGVLGRGGCWADAAAGFSLVNTILPPNSPSCAVNGNHRADGIFSAGSWHPSGAHVLLADASVRFITDSIDAGDSSKAADLDSPSPYGLWGALGTAAADDSDDRSHDFR